MNTKDLFKFALRNLTTRGLRSWLTVIGIVIGVAAIVTIVSIGQGMQGVITEQLGHLGGDAVYIMPGGSQSSQMMGGAAKETGHLKEVDMKIINSVEGVQAVAPDILGMKDVYYLDEARNMYIWGTNEEWAEARGESFGIESGRFLAKGDKGIAVLGNSAAHNLFDKEIFVGSNIRIQNKSYRIVGILAKFGGLGGQGEDNSVYLTLDDAQEYSMLDQDQYYMFEIKVDIERTEEIAERIKQQLMISRHVNEENIDFDVVTAKMISSTVNNIVNTINFFLFGIAAISLIVGGVGIANTMFTSVTERTRQIGILKALGMTNADVLSMFIIEAGLIGLVGGIIGLLVGFIISGIVGEISLYALGGSTPIVSISFWLVLFSILFSVIIGIISGIIPAKRASALQPIEALRYE